MGSSSSKTPPRDSGSTPIDPLLSPPVQAAEETGKGAGAGSESNLGQPSVRCAACHRQFPRAAFSKAQIYKAVTARRCPDCTSRSAKVQPFPKGGFPNDDDKPEAPKASGEANASGSEGMGGKAGEPGLGKKVGEGGAGVGAAGAEGEDSSGSKSGAGAAGEGVGGQMGPANMDFHVPRDIDVLSEATWHTAIPIGENPALPLKVSPRSPLMSRTA